MHRLSFALISAVSVLAFTQVSSAADIARPVYKAPPPVPPPVSDWSGIYSGFEGGYGWGHENFDPNFDPFGDFFWANQMGSGFPTPSIDSVHQKGWLLGGFVGAQKQWGSWVLGIEADYDAAEIKGSSTSSVTENFAPDLCVEELDGCVTSVSRSVSVDSKIDGLGSVRGKTGWAFAPNWLVYGTGGLAFAHVKYSATLSQTESYSTGVIGGNFTDNYLGGASRLGWSLGAGIDWRYQIDQGSSWVFGVEYLHYGFPADTITLTDQLGSGESLAINSKQSVDTIKGRISYLFSIH